MSNETSYPSAVYPQCRECKGYSFDIGVMVYVEDINYDTDALAKKYKPFLEVAFENRKCISKTRYSFTYDGKTVEVDIFPFWNDRAFAEVELESETEQISLPDELKVIKEVTGDRLFTNYDMAESC